MNIDELIKKLQDLRDRYGSDIPVYLCYPDSETCRHHTDLSHDAVIETNTGCKDEPTRVIIDTFD